MSRYRLSTSAAGLSSSIWVSWTEKSLRRECTAKNPSWSFEREDSGRRRGRPDERNVALLLLPTGSEEGEKEVMLSTVLLLRDPGSGSSRLGSCRDGELALAISA